MQSYHRCPPQTWTALLMKVCIENRFKSRLWSVSYMYKICANSRIFFIDSCRCAFQIWIHINAYLHTCPCCHSHRTEAMESWDAGCRFNCQKISFRGLPCARRIMDDLQHRNQATCTSFTFFMHWLYGYKVGVTLGVNSSIYYLTMNFVISVDARGSRFTGLLDDLNRVRFQIVEVYNYLI